MGAAKEVYGAQKKMLCGPWRTHASPCVWPAWSSAASKGRRGVLVLATAESAAQWLDGLRINRFHVGLMFLVGLVEMFSGYNSQIIAYTMPQITQDWGLNPVLAGTLSSYAFVGFMVGAAAFGVIADRIGRKRALVLAFIVFSAFGGLSGLAPNFTVFVIVRFLAGVGMGAALPIAIALVAEYAPARARGRAVTAMTCGFNLGWAVAGLGAILIIPALGWRAALLAGSLPLILVPVLWRWLPESVRFLAEKRRYEEAVRELRRIEAAAGGPGFNWSPGHFGGSAPPVRSSSKEIFRHGLAATTLLLWAMYFLAFLVIYGLSMWLPTLLLASGFSLAQGYGLGMLQAVWAVAGGLFSGYLLDRLGRKPVLAGYYFLGGVALCSLAVVSSGIALAVATAATGVFIIAAPIPQHVVAGETYPTHVRSTGVGWALTVGRVGSILGPILGGAMQLAGFGPALNFLLLAIPCFVCGALVLLPVFRTLGRAQGASLAA